MPHRKAISITAALALAAGILSVPSTTVARGGGGFGAHGPVFGFHPRFAGHRPFRPAFAHRAARFGWHLRRSNRGQRDGAGTGAGYPAYDAGVSAPYTGDVTGGLPGPGVFVPPVVAPAPPEHIGCLARGYEVPAEVGGVARVTVIRC